MFFHKFKYTLKILLKNKTMLFWTFAFPIFLGTFFYMAFSDIEDNEKMHVIDIAIINNEDFINNVVYKGTFESLSKKNDNQVFNIEYTDLEKANELLDEGNISGYLKMEGEIPNLVFLKNGADQTVLKYVVDTIENNKAIIKNSIEEKMKNGDFFDIGSLQTEIQNKLNKDVIYNNISNSNMSYTMIEFYTLIAMAALYGGMIVMTALNYEDASISSIGKRNSIMPVKKSGLVFSSLLASYILQIIGLTLLFLYTIFILKVDYGTKLPQIILLGFVGALSGSAIGVFASTLKINDNAKSGVMIAYTMLCSFLSGMMGITMKYIVDTNAPIINKINPCAMITDGLYSLYYYSDNKRFLFDLISIIIYSIVVILISVFILRRSKHEHI